MRPANHPPLHPKPLVNEDRENKVIKRIYMIKRICATLLLVAGMSLAQSGPAPLQNRPGYPTSRAIQSCQDSVANWLQRTGYRRVGFERTYFDDRPGRKDWVLGTAYGQRGVNMRFSFNCSVDSRSGRVRTFDVRRR
jgi:hypothetical protein